MRSLLIGEFSDDRLIPMHHGKRLFEAANEPKNAFWVEGAGHNEVFISNVQAYLEAIRGFISAIPDQ